MNIDWAGIFALLAAAPSAWAAPSMLQERPIFTEPVGLATGGPVTQSDWLVSLETEGVVIEREDGRTFVAPWRSGEAPRPIVYSLRIIAPQATVDPRDALVLVATAPQPDSTILVTVDRLEAEISAPEGLEDARDVAVSIGPRTTLFELDGSGLRRWHAAESDASELDPVRRAVKSIRGGRYEWVDLDIGDRRGAAITALDGGCAVLTLPYDVRYDPGLRARGSVLWFEDRCSHLPLAVDAVDLPGPLPVRGVLTIGAVWNPEASAVVERRAVIGCPTDVFGEAGILDLATDADGQETLWRPLVGDSVSDHRYCPPAQRLAISTWPDVLCVTSDVDDWAGGVVRAFAFDDGLEWSNSVVQGEPRNVAIHDHRVVTTFAIGTTTRGEGPHGYLAGWSVVTHDLSSGELVKTTDFPVAPLGERHR